MTTTGGQGLRPRSRITEAERQRVLDAAALLQLRRSGAAAALAGGERTAGRIVARGNPDIDRWMRAAAHCWREVLSVRPAATVAQLQVSLPRNREQLDRGLRMVSVFDLDGLDPDARLLLSGEGHRGYLFGAGAVQMKIVDRREVLLQGPFVDGEPTLMALSSQPCLAAARRYWEAVVASSFPATEYAHGLECLTPRQRQIVALLATDAGDDAVAAALDVSVRTVRSDIAALMDVLGVRSRFSAGLRIRVGAGAEG